MSLLFSTASRLIRLPAGLSALCILPEIQQIRTRKRGLKRALSKAEKLARRLKREEKEAARKQYSFMERIHIRRMKNMQSPSQMGPGRLEPEAEEALPQAPPCNVYFRSDIRCQLLSIGEALAIHRMQQRPEIYNNPNAVIKLRLELNMTTEKATKMVPPSDEIVPLPFPFPHKEKRAILAFANDQETQDRAIEAGAEIALGADMVKKIVKGQFRIDDYDFCVAHSNMQGLMAPLRGILRSRFPTIVNGALGDNLEEMVDRFRRGCKVAVTGDPIYPQWGLSEPVVGRLMMADNELEENIKAVVAAVCQHRTPALGVFVNRATINAYPGKTYIPVDVSAFYPTLTEEELEKFEKRQQKKKKPKKEVVSTDEENADDYLLALM